MKGPALLMAAVVGGAIASCGQSSTTHTAASPGGSCVKAPSNLVQAGTLTIGSDETAPPQTFVENLKAVGADVDLGDAIAKQMCLTPMFVNANFDGLIAALQAGKYDALMSAMTITAERSQVVSFVPYFNAGEEFVGLKGSTIHITNINQICGLRVNTQVGTTEAQQMMAVKCPSNKAVKISIYSEENEALAQLQKGDVDGYFTDSPVAAYAVEQNSGLEIISTDLFVAPEGIAVQKSATALFAAISQALKNLETDGTYAQILRKWDLADGDITKTST